MAVIETEYVPAFVEVKLHDVDTVALAFRTVAAVGQVTVKPALGLARELRATVPEKLKVLVKLTDIAIPVAPELKFTGVFVRIVKSPT